MTPETRPSHNEKLIKDSQLLRGIAKQAFHDVLMAQSVLVCDEFGVPIVPRQTGREGLS